MREISIYSRGKELRRMITIMLRHEYVVCKKTQATLVVRQGLRQCSMAGVTWLMAVSRMVTGREESLKEKKR